MKHAGTLLAPVLLALLLPFAAGAVEGGEALPRATRQEAAEIASALESTGRALAAARLQVAQASPAQPMSPTQAARLELKLAQYEEELRRLTGRVEELSYRLDQLSRRLDLLGTDVDGRLSRLESGSSAGAGAAAPVSGNGAAPAAGAAAGAAAAGAAGTAGATVAGRGPRTLGTVSSGEVAALQQQPAPQAAPGTAPGAAGGESARDQYQRAYGLLAQQRWAEAETAFRGFLKDHPEDTLAPNATYWLAETYYARKDYTSAATLFAEGFEKYPNGQKAPDNLLKLGISLANIGRKQDACDTLLALKERYPSAAPTILQRADRQRSDLGC